VLHVPSAAHWDYQNPPPTPLHKNLRGCLASATAPLLKNWALGFDNLGADIVDAGRAAAAGTGYAVLVAHAAPVGAALLAAPGRVLFGGLHVSYRQWLYDVM
jgi:hypothetical protein